MDAARPRSRAQQTRRRTRQLLAVLVTALLIATISGGGAGARDEPTGSSPEHPKIGSGVLDALRRGDAPAIIVALDAASPRDLHALRREIAAAQTNALRRVTEDEIEVRQRFVAVPAFSAVAHSEAAVRRLASEPGVRRIDLDLDGVGTLAASVPVIRADLRHDRGNRGEGVVVAVLDTGFDSSHEDLAGAVVHEACFGDNTGTIDGDGFCPDGSDRQTGDGAAEDDQGHGTHVTGIITSNGTVAGTGMAPGAAIAAIKVLDSGGVAGRFFAFSEIVAALDHIIDNPAVGVQVVNMSLATNALFAGECDDTSAATMAGADAADALRASGVTLFAASGNAGSATQMPLPACLSSVISVGATDNDDNVAGFSNSNETTDIFAPGVDIVSARMGGGTRESSGTSMASPHAAGCAALLIEADDATTPDEIEARLKASDVQVTDPKNDLTFPRIDCVPDVNQPPELTVAEATVLVDEGDIATNSGAFSDPDGDAVTLNVSVGTVVDNGDGTWSWAFATIDGPADSQTVTVTGTDALDAESTVTFELTVANVAPTVDVGPDAIVLSNEMFEFEGSFSDPGVIDFPWSWVIDWDDNTQTVGSTNDQTASIAASHGFCAADTYTITLSVTDKDHDTGTDTLDLTVQHVPVLIDIKPEDGTTPISLSGGGLIPVAILTTAEFDATSVDPATVTLGDGSGSGTGVAQRPNGTLFASIEDVDGDGMPDLMLHFRTQELVDNGDLSSTTTTLYLEGFLQDGCTNILGSENVTLVP